MILLPPGAASKRVKWLKSFCVFYGIAVAVSCLGLIACTSLWTVRRNQARDDAATQQKRVKKATSDLESLKRLPTEKAFDGLAAAGAFQEFLDKVAFIHRCQVDDLHASPDMQLYLSRYSKTTTDKGWSQVPVSVTVQGPTASVFDTISELGQCNVPLEIDSVTLVREALGSKGEATVGAHLELRVLARTKEGT